MSSYEPLKELARLEALLLEAWTETTHGRYGDTEVIDRCVEQALGLTKDLRAALSRVPVAEPPPAEKK